jgi:hypothetical protein
MNRPRGNARRKGKKKGTRMHKSGKKGAQTKGRNKQGKGEKKNEEGRRFMNVYKLLRAQSC